MDDGRDYRFSFGGVLFGGGLFAMVTVGVAVTNPWLNPWFLVCLGATIVGAVLLVSAWVGLRRKSEAVPALLASPDPKDRPRPIPASPTWRRGEGLSNWEAGHDVRDGGVLLSVRSTDTSELGLVICRVQEPDGHIHRSLFRIPPPGESSSRGRWEFFYPTEFFEAPAEVWSGRYTVKWTAGGNDTLVARDEFDVPT